MRVLSTRIDIRNISELIEFGVSHISVDNIKTIKLIDWSSINVDKYPKHIRGNKYLRHIQLIEIRVLFGEINISNLFV